MRMQCDKCNEWSRELVQIKGEYGGSHFYFVHAHEVADMKLAVKAARAQIKADKAQALATYGRRYHH
jgi:hypothetical protein